VFVGDWGIVSLKDPYDDMVGELTLEGGKENDDVEPSVINFSSFEIYKASSLIMCGLCCGTAFGPGAAKIEDTKDLTAWFSSNSCCTLALPTVSD
jgi:hypothetical protein